jgi:hypothetical protein
MGPDMGSVLQAQQRSANPTLAATRKRLTSVKRAIPSMHCAPGATVPWRDQARPRQSRQGVANSFFPFLADVIDRVAYKRKRDLVIRPIELGRDRPHEVGCPAERCGGYGIGMGTPMATPSDCSCPLAKE